MKPLTPKTLNGLWAAIATPFKNAGEIDYSALKENCVRLASTGVDGIYTTDSDGEFYAIEWDEFKTLSKKFGETLADLDVSAQMGVTWINTRGIIDRIKASVDAGINTVHVGFPFFMPLTTADVSRFFSDPASAVPQARWIYYGHPSCLPLLKGRELAKLAAEFPDQLIGTKLNAYEISDLTDVFTHCPNLAHFVGERNLLFGSLLGARGCYSYWVNTMPAWTRSFYDACQRKDVARATELHLKLYRWETTALAEIRQLGYRYGIIGKARGHLRDFLVHDGSTRAPHQPVPQKLLTELKVRFEEYWAAEIQQETAAAKSQTAVKASRK